MKRWLLKLHRWAALTFAVPLACVLVSGLVLSVEPWVASGSIVPGSLTVERLQALLAQHDPAGRARAIAYRSYDGTLTIGRGAGASVVDVASGGAQPSLSPLASLFGSLRRFHETLLIDDTLVVTSTAVMLALIVVGVLMGVPRLANTLAGWHKGIAWGLLPLLVLSPLTALLMAGGISFAGRPAHGGDVPPPRLVDAVRVVGESHDLSGLVWLRPQGNRTLARLIEDGEYRVYQVTDAGVSPLPRNWPRLWHEGNFAGRWSALMNVVVSLGLLGLLASGVWLWARRRWRRARVGRP